MSYFPAQRLQNNHSYYNWDALLTRPSANYAKDWLDQLFIFLGLVWKRVSPVDVITVGQLKTIFMCNNPSSV